MKTYTLRRWGPLTFVYTREGEVGTIARTGDGSRAFRWRFRAFRTSGRANPAFRDFATETQAADWIAQGATKGDK